MGECFSVPGRCPARINKVSLALLKLSKLNGQLQHSIKLSCCPSLDFQRASTSRTKPYIRHRRASDRSGALREGKPNPPQHPSKNGPSLVDRTSNMCDS